MLVGTDSMSRSCATTRVPPAPEVNVTITASPGIRLARPTLAPPLVMLELESTRAWTGLPTEGWMAIRFSAAETARMVPSMGVPTRLELAPPVPGLEAWERGEEGCGGVLAKMVRDAASRPAARTARAANAKMISTARPEWRRRRSDLLRLPMPARTLGLLPSRRPDGACTSATGHPPNNASQAPGSDASREPEYRDSPRPP